MQRIQRASGNKVGQGVGATPFITSFLKPVSREAATATLLALGNEIGEKRRREEEAAQLAAEQRRQVRAVPAALVAAAAPKGVPLAALPSRACHSGLHTQGCTQGTDIN